MAVCWEQMYYGWVVVLSAAVIRILVYGISFTSGVVYVVILENFKTGVAETSWISSLITSVTFMITPLAGVLVNKFGWRVVSFGGGLLTCCGLLLSLLSTNLFMLCLFYGVVTGAGLGIGYMGGSLAVPRYFQHKKVQNLAVGVASAGGGVGTFIFPPIIRFLDNKYGWKGMFMILAGISLHICVFGLLYRPLPNTDENKNPTKRKRRSSSHVPEANDWSFLKSPVFHFVAMNNFLFAFGASIIYGHLAAYSEFHMHLDKNEAAVLYSVIGISVTIAKITQGLVADFHKVHPIFKAINQYILFYLIGGLATLFLLVDTGFAGLIVYCVFFGASSAANGGSLIPAILMELFGQNKLSLPYGVVLAEMSLGTVLGAPAAGWMYEHSKNYHHPLLVASVSMILSAVVMWYPRRYLMSPRETLMALDIESPTEEQDGKKYFNEKDEKEIHGVEEKVAEMATLISPDTDEITGYDTDTST